MERHSLNCFPFAQSGLGGPLVHFAITLSCSTGIAVAGLVVMGLAFASLLITRSVKNAGTMVRL